MFDETEAPSQSLQNEYESWLRDNPLRASELLVPSSFRQLGTLRRTGKVVSLSKEEPIGFQALHIPEQGLSLYSPCTTIAV